MNGEIDIKEKLERDTRQAAASPWQFQDKKSEVKLTTPYEDTATKDGGRKESLTEDSLSSS
jgi:hypothetical protein